jgi:hypothetical protein
MEKAEDQGADVDTEKLEQNPPEKKLFTEGGEDRENDDIGKSEAGKVMSDDGIEPGKGFKSIQDVAQDDDKKAQDKTRKYDQV